MSDTRSNDALDTDPAPGRHHRPSPTPRRPSAGVPVPDNSTAPTPPSGLPAANGRIPEQHTPTLPDKQRRAAAAPEEAAGSLVDLVRGAPRVDAADAIGMVRVAGTVVWRAVNAVTRRSVGAATEIVRDVQSGEPVSDIIDNQVEKARSAAIAALGLDSNQMIAGIAPTPGVISRFAGAPTAPRTPSGRVLTAEDLKVIGNRMLRSSAYAANQPHDVHPAFAQMLSSLTPDEVRILRFFAVAGPQPSLDVRTKTPFGIGSERLAGGLNLIAEMAGCSYPHHDQHYLANLNRLGLVRFSQEPVADFRRYSLIEAQPKVTEAMERAKRAATVYRSIYLSLFGQQFCDACFDLEGYSAGGWADDDRGDKILGKGTPKLKKKHHA